MKRRFVDGMKEIRLTKHVIGCCFLLQYFIFASDVLLDEFGVDGKKGG